MKTRCSMLRLHMILAGMLLPMAAAIAGGQQAEIQRGPMTPQAQGVLHTLRTIPEACARLQGQFTGTATAPYTLTPVRTSERCQARAQLQDAHKVQASTANGWILNDELRVPNASCPGQLAVIRIWRKEAVAATPKLDAQGRVRVYLKDGLDAATAGKLGARPQYAVAMAVEGNSCK
jgi:hypothetical protein